LVFCVNPAFNYAKGIIPNNYSPADYGFKYILIALFLFFTFGIFHPFAAHVLLIAIHTTGCFVLEVVEKFKIASFAPFCSGMRRF